MRRHPTQTLFFGALGLASTFASAAVADGWVTFVNETSTRLVAPTNLGSADPEEKDFAYADFDKDGDIDLIVVRKEPFTTPTGKRNLLLMNEAGVLTDRTTSYAIAADDGGQGFLDITNDRDVALGDFNNDGWLDFVTCPALNQSLPKTISHPRIYMNLGNGGGGSWLGFKYEVNRIPTMPQAPNGCGIATGDVTGDGFADIYLTDYNSSQEDRLLINNGAGFFADETASRMTATMISSGFGTACAIVDMNGDGVNDVVKSENGPFKATYNNPGQLGHFNKHETVSAGSHYGMSVGDLNNDGKLDAVVGDDGSDRFLLNTGNGGDGMANFESKTFSFQSGGDDGFGNNSRIVDLNNDGFKDVLIADVDVDIGGCSRRLHMYRNLGNTPSVTIQEQGTGGIPAGELSGTHDVAVFDINGDGWNDLVIGRCIGLRVWINKPPIGVVTAYPDGLPAFVTPNESTTFAVSLTAFGGGTIVPDSPTLHYVLPGGTEQTSPLIAVRGGGYSATLPAAACTDTINWWVTSLLAPGSVAFVDPPAGGASPYTALAALGTEITLRQEFENGTGGWQVETSPALTGGAWVLADPNGTVSAGSIAAPEDDATSGDGLNCFVTGNTAPGGAAGSGDVDNGPTALTTPPINLAGQDAIISFAAWFFCDDVGAVGADALAVLVSDDSGATWHEALQITTTNSTWKTFTFRVSDYVEPTAAVKVRFQTDDTPNNSITDAGIDNFQVETILCQTPCAADFTADGAVDGADLAFVLGAWGQTGVPGFPGDVTSDGTIDGADLAAVLGAWGSCP